MYMCFYVFADWHTHINNHVPTHFCVHAETQWQHFSMQRAYVTKVRCSVCMV